MRTIARTACALALAFSVAAPASIFATDAEAQRNPKRSERYVLTVDAGGPYCGYIKAKKANPISFALENRIFREACFPTLGQCRNWLYWAQSYFGDVTLTRRCG